MKKLWFCMCILFASISVNASGYLVPLGQGVTIQKIHAHNNGGITLWVDASGLTNVDTCDNMSKVHIKSDISGYETIVSLVLAAYMSNQKVGLHSPGCETIPFWGGTTKYPIASNVWITK